MLHVGIVGAGAIARIHAEQWQKLPVTISAVFDRHPDRAEAFCAEYGGTPAASLSELLGRIDVVDVCTHTDGRRAIVEAAAAASIPVICEKPLGRTLRDCEAMLEACNATNTPLFVAHVVRFFPQYVRARELVAAGAIGRLAVLRTARAGSHPRPGAFFSSPFYADYARSGGVILDLGIHELDFQLWCAGPVERVFAHGLIDRSIPYTDHALISLHFASGAIGQVECSWALPPGHFRTSLELSGDGGRIEWESTQPAPLRWAISSASGAEAAATGSSSPLAEQDDPYLLQLAHFVECLTLGSACRITPAEAANAVKVALAALASVRTGRPVELASFKEDAA